MWCRHHCRPRRIDPSVVILLPYLNDLLSMKKTLTLATLAFALYTHAQPTLTFATNAPVAGTTYTIEHGNYVSPGSGGAAQSWDLSGLTSDSTAVMQLVAPSTTTNGAQFPNATVAEVSAPVTSYYQVTANGIGFAGSDDGTSLIANTPAPRYLAFPCSMGTSWSTPYEAQFNYDGNDVFRSGTVSGEADGYGILTMPWGTVPNVLRIHLMNVVQDSMALFTLHYTYDSYVYYRVGRSYPIAELVTATIDMGFGEPQVEQFSRWTSELSTGITAAAMVDGDLHVYPNPASGEVNFAMPAEMGTGTTVSVMDASGRLVQQLAPITGTLAHLEVQDLASGLYTLMLTGREGQRIATRFIKR